jgi:hypothetical protein
MKGAALLALIFLISVFAGCLEEEGENELYASVMKSLSAPDTRFITNLDGSLTYDFGNERIIAQSNALFGIEKLWVVNVSDPLLEMTRTEISTQRGYMSPSAAFSRSNIFALYYSGPNAIAVTCCSNDSGLVQSIIPQKNDMINLTLHVYKNGSISEHNNSLSIGGLCITSNLRWKNYTSFTDGADIFFEADEPIFIELSDQVSDPYESFKKAFERADWIDNRFSAESSLYETMFSSALDCALSAYKQSNGTGALFAGTKYRDPARTYFRDSYWTSQILLPFAPDIIREQVLTLARGVHDDGQCPSGVFFNGTDWWSDHYDSPSYFVMLLYDYISWTGDSGILDKKAGNMSVWEKALKCMEYLSGTDTNGNFLPEKPWRCERDWADQVYRDSEVAYDSILYYRALTCASEIAEARGEVISEDLCARAEEVKKSINRVFWNEELGYYIDYVRDVPSHTEEHLNEDTFIAVLYGVADEHQREAYLKSATRLLDTKNNRAQPYGDWGVMCCYPLYSSYLLGMNGRGGDTFETSALPYHYHNGSDWPYLDGINAFARLWYGDADWEYPLTRWWEYSIEMKWLTPVEWYTPEPSSKARTWGFKQGWSSMPGAALLMGGLGFWPTLNGTIGIAVPPFGNSMVDFEYRGKECRLLCKDGKTSFYIDGEEVASIDSGSRARIDLDEKKVFDVRNDCNVYLLGESISAKASGDGTTLE